MRHKFLDEFSEKGYNGEGGTIYLKIKDLYRVIDVLKYFLKEENWEGDFSSIWDWYEMLPRIAKSISNIIRFLQEIEENNYESESEDKLKNKDFEIYYYDSY